MLTRGELEQFNESLDRCTGAPPFFDRFYEVFLGSSDEVAKKFEQTDFVKQKQALKSSLYLIMMAAEGREDTQAHLERLAQIHSRGERDIAPELYELWLDSLLKVVLEFDPFFTLELDRIWRKAMHIGIDFMIERY